MDQQHLFFTSQDDFEPIIGTFDQGFDDFMCLSDAGFLNDVLDSRIGLHLEALTGSPTLNIGLEEQFQKPFTTYTTEQSLHLEAVANSTALNVSLEEAEEDGEENCGEGTSSGTTTKPRRDRSKTLVSERRRRSSMKDKLYELRSLVPNITKMDKASIIADAMVYVQSLQDQVKKLTDEVLVLESSASKGDQTFKAPVKNLGADQVEGSNNQQCRGKILGVVAHEVGECRLYVKVECSKGDGVASALYKAIESLECFHVESSKITLNLDRYSLTLSLNVRGAREVVTTSSMKLWVMSALLKEGFGFDMTTI